MILGQNMGHINTESDIDHKSSTSIPSTWEFDIEPINTDVLYRTR